MSDELNGHSELRGPRKIKGNIDLGLVKMGKDFSLN